VIFSGQILAQMIMAADRAVEGTKEVKSIHAIFARAGSYDAPMELRLETMHAGRAWGSHTITASQGDRLLCRGLVLLSAEEPDLIRHGPVMPDVAPPDELESDWPVVVYPGSETRTVPDAKATAPDGSPASSFWLRHDTAYRSVAANHAILAWSEPGFIIGLAMRPHSQIVRIEDAHRTVSTGVIAHTASFHERLDISQWHLVTQQASYAGRGRVHGTGRVFNGDGQLVATFSQDSMARGVDRPLGPKHL
jgi:acyl-CoA thioesterase